MLSMRPAVMAKMCRSVAVRSFVMSGKTRTLTVVLGHAPCFVAEAKAALGHGRTEGMLMPTGAVMEGHLVALREVRSFVRPRAVAVMRHLFAAMLEVLHPGVRPAMAAFMSKARPTTMMTAKASAARHGEVLVGPPTLLGKGLTMAPMVRSAATMAVPTWSLAERGGYVVPRLRIRSARMTRHSRWTVGVPHVIVMVMACVMAMACVV